jgi:hypothetical protein
MPPHPARNIIGLTPDDANGCQMAMWQVDLGVSISLATASMPDACGHLALLPTALAG